MIAIHIPGPELIREECHEIRQAWTAAECVRRAENALRRQAELLNLLEDSEDPCASERSLPASRLPGHSAMAATTV